MSSLPGVSSTKGEKSSKSGKFTSYNINAKFKGKPVEQTKSSITKHGLQSLGKVATVRRVPPPINLPSLKSENLGIDPSVNLVPGGSAGWGASKEENHVPVKENSVVTPTAAPPAVVPQKAVPIPSAEVSTKPPPIVTGVDLAPSSSKVTTWSSVTSGNKDAPNRFFQSDFPSLAAGAATTVSSSVVNQVLSSANHYDKATSGPVAVAAEGGLSLRPQSEGSWSQGGATKKTPSSEETLTPPTSLPNNDHVVKTIPTPPTHIPPPFLYSHPPPPLTQPRNGPSLPAGGGPSAAPTTTPASLPRYNAEHNRPSFLAPRGESSRIHSSSIIKGEEMSRMDLLMEDADDSWTRKPDIDYEKKMNFSDDEEESSAPDVKARAKEREGPEKRRSVEETDAPPLHKGPPPPTSMGWQPRGYPPYDFMMQHPPMFPPYAPPSMAPPPISRRVPSYEEEGEMRARRAKEVQAAAERGRRRKEEEEMPALDKERDFGSSSRQSTAALQQPTIPPRFLRKQNSIGSNGGPVPPQPSSTSLGTESGSPQAPDQAHRGPPPGYSEADRKLKAAAAAAQSEKAAASNWADGVSPSSTVSSVGADVSASVSWGGCPPPSEQPPPLLDSSTQGWASSWKSQGGKDWAKDDEEEKKKVESGEAEAHATAEAAVPSKGESEGNKKENADRPALGAWQVKASKSTASTLPNNDAGILELTVDLNSGWEDEQLPSSSTAGKHSEGGVKRRSGRNEYQDVLPPSRRTLPNKSRRTRGENTRPAAPAPITRERLERSSGGRSGGMASSNMTTLRPRLGGARGGNKLSSGLPGSDPKKREDKIPSLMDDMPEDLLPLSMTQAKNARAAAAASSVREKEEKREEVVRASEAEGVGLPSSAPPPQPNAWSKGISSTSTDGHGAGGGWADEVEEEERREEEAAEARKKNSAGPGSYGYPSGGGERRNERERRWPGGRGGGTADRGGRGRRQVPMEWISRTRRGGGGDRRGANAVGGSGYYGGRGTRGGYSDGRRRRPEDGTPRRGGWGFGPTSPNYASLEHEEDNEWVEEDEKPEEATRPPNVAPSGDGDGGGLEGEEISPPRRKAGGVDASVSSTRRGTGRLMARGMPSRIGRGGYPVGAPVRGAGTGARRNARDREWRAETAGGRNEWREWFEPREGLGRKPPGERKDNIRRKEDGGAGRSQYRDRERGYQPDEKGDTGKSGGYGEEEGRGGRGNGGEGRGYGYGASTRSTRGVARRQYSGRGERGNGDVRDRVPQLNAEGKKREPSGKEKEAGCPAEGEGEKEAPSEEKVSSSAPSNVPAADKVKPSPLSPLGGEKGKSSAPVVEKQKKRSPTPPEKKNENPLESYDLNNIASVVIVDNQASAMLESDLEEAGFQEVQSKRSKAKQLQQTLEREKSASTPDGKGKREREKRGGSGDQKKYSSSGRAKAAASSGSRGRNVKEEAVVSPVPQHAPSSSVPPAATKPKTNAWDTPITQVLSKVSLGTSAPTPGTPSPSNVETSKPVSRAAVEESPRHVFDEDVSSGHIGTIIFENTKIRAGKLPTPAESHVGKGRNILEMTSGGENLLQSSPPVVSIGSPFFRPSTPPPIVSLSQHALERASLPSDAGRLLSQHSATNIREQQHTPDEKQQLKKQALPLDIASPISPSSIELKERIAAVRKMWDVQDKDLSLDHSPSASARADVAQDVRRTPSQLTAQSSSPVGRSLSPDRQSDGSGPSDSRPPVVSSHFDLSKPESVIQVSSAQTPPNICKVKPQQVLNAMSASSNTSLPPPHFPASHHGLSHQGLQSYLNSASSTNPNPYPSMGMPPPPTIPSPPVFSAPIFTPPPGSDSNLFGVTQSAPSLRPQSPAAPAFLASPPTDILKMYGSSPQPNPAAPTVSVGGGGGPSKRLMASASGYPHMSLNPYEPLGNAAFTPNFFTAPPPSHHPPPAPPPATFFPTPPPAFTAYAHFPPPVHHPPPSTTLSAGSQAYRSMYKEADMDAFYGTAPPFPPNYGRDASAVVGKFLGTGGLGTALGSAMPPTSIPNFAANSGRLAGGSLGGFGAPALRGMGFAPALNIGNVRGAPLGSFMAIPTTREYSPQPIQRPSAMDARQASLTSMPSGSEVDAKSDLLEGTPDGGAGKDDGGEE